MLHTYYGNGKGKTTAAMGLALRMRGANKSVLVIQFLKDGKSSEIKQLIELGVSVKFKKMPKMFIDLNDCKMIKEVGIMQNELFDCIDNQYDCIILDEILDAIVLNLINEDKVYRKLKELKEDKEIVLTGRKPTIKIQQLSDYSTQMKMNKHPYNNGVNARKGIEF